MNRYDQQRTLLALAGRLASDLPLPTADRELLAEALYRIAEGEDANKVLKVQGKRGDKKADAIARRRMSFILHWVAGAIAKDLSFNDKPISLAEACRIAAEKVVPLAKQLYPGADGRTYDSDYILDSWKHKDYRHMKSPLRGWYDPDFPYHWP